MIRESCWFGNCLEYYFFFLYVLVFWSWSLRDLSSLTTDRICTPCIGRWSLNHWTAREVPGNALVTLCISTFCGNVYYFRRQLHRILSSDLRAHSKSWFEAIVQAPDGRCRGGTGWLLPIWRQVLHENWWDTQTRDWEPAPWQDWEALAGVIKRPAGQIPHDLREKRHFQLFTLTQGRASRGYWWSLRWVQEKAMATHSSTLAWKIPWTEDPGRLQSMGSLRVRHDWATSLSLFTFMHWRRKWQPTPVFLPGESQGWRSLVGCCLWGHTELDMTEVT